MDLYLAETMRRIDRESAERGISGWRLMTAAAGAVAAAAIDRWPRARRVAVLCGAGNNGGDGYLVAVRLRRAGREVRLYALGEPGAGDARRARDEAVTALGEPTPLSGDVARLGAALADCDLLIDALFGSGLSRPLAGDAAAIVTAMNDSGRPILSVDVPSGVDADRAVPPGPHVRATRTVELAGACFAGALLPARAAFGVRQVADIGVPAPLLARADGTLLDGHLLTRHVPKRAADAHKYTVGTVMVFAGSARYLGAAELACRAAYRGGAGLVTLAADERFLGGWPEIAFEPLDGGSLAAARERAGDARAGSLVIGPGLEPGGGAEIGALLDRHRGPALLDAGALQRDEELQEAVRRHGGCALTPHHGEAARLLGRDGGEVRSDPVGAARDLAASWGAVVVLKGAGAVVAAPDGRVLISDRGHPGMAAGGTGDVLAGLAGAWLVDGDPLWRCGAAAFVHGRAGELAAERYGNGLVAGDLVDLLPAAERSLHAVATTAGGRSEA